MPNDLPTKLHDKRMQSFNERFPQLQKNNLSDTQYKEDLLNQYEALRRECFLNFCLSKGLSAYNDNLDRGPARMNTLAWKRNAWNPGNYTSAPLREMRAKPDSAGVYNNSNIVSSWAPSAGKAAASCAVTSNCIQYAICEAMGYQKEALDEIIDKNESMRATAPVRSPKVAQHTSGNGNTRYNLWTLIENGKAGPGSGFSIKSNAAPSGNHQQTVVDVQYGPDGKLASFTYQGTNSTCLKVVKKRADSPECFAVNLEQWMYKKISKEKEALRNKDIESIKATVEETKNRVRNSIEAINLEEQFMYNCMNRNFRTAYHIPVNDTQLEFIQGYMDYRKDSFLTSGNDCDKFRNQRRETSFNTVKPNATAQKMQDDAQNARRQASENKPRTTQTKGATQTRTYSSKSTSQSTKNANGKGKVPVRPAAYRGGKGGK